MLFITSLNQRKHTSAGTAAARESQQHWVLIWKHQSSVTQVLRIASAHGSTPTKRPPFTRPYAALLLISNEQPHPRGGRLLLSAGVRQNSCSTAKRCFFHAQMFICVNIVVSSGAGRWVLSKGGLLIGLLSASKSINQSSSSLPRWPLLCSIVTLVLPFLWPL